MASDTEKVRLLISDVGGDSGTDYIFSDADIAIFLEMDAHVYRASALALRTLAANEALVQKRITYLDLSTDGSTTANALLKAAYELEERAVSSEADDVVPDVINMGDSPFTQRDLRMDVTDLEDNL